MSFELSKHGWNVYNPVYDEYVDFLIHKHVCKKCNLKWNMTPALVCKNCGKDFSKGEKPKIKPKKICNSCSHEMIGNQTKCSNCCSTEIIPIATCYACNGEVEIKKHNCQCGSIEYHTKFRTIQVKSSRLEKNKKTYAIDMKPRDLIDDGYHFYIWCCIDNEDRPHFLVLSVNEFIDNMGKSLKGTSFLKDQDRQHFALTNTSKWHKFINEFSKLEF
ncbi:hypothetical protein ACFX5K_03165 [Rickettsiales bacterium LUAb2]